MEPLTAPLCSVHAIEICKTILRANRTPALLPEREDVASIAAADREWRAEQAIRLARRDEPGFVYYVLIDSQVKIGYAKDVRKRMRAYPPTAELLAVEPGSLNLERARHQQFDAYRTAGREWFRPNEELDRHIAAVLTEHGDCRKFAHRYGTPRRAP